MICSVSGGCDMPSRFAALDTNTVSDALDFLGLAGATCGLRPLWDCPKIVGRASTIQLGLKTDAKVRVGRSVAEVMHDSQFEAVRLTL